MKFVYPEGATPIDPDEAGGLIPAHISLQRELNEWEEKNILDALAWASSHAPINILTDDFIRQLHRRMFDQTWRWAGKYRRTDKNIGVPWYRVPEDVRNLCADVSFWVKDQVYTPDESAVRFHHRLVLIHPFPNGNGRHARLASDLLAVRLGRPSFTWGRSSLVAMDETRKAYILALQKADGGDINPLFAFARS